MVQSFIQQHLLNIFYKPAIALGTSDKGKNKRVNVPLQLEPSFNCVEDKKQITKGGKKIMLCFKKKIIIVLFLQEWCPNQQLSLT